MSETLSVGGTAPNDPMHEYATLYPDVVPEGSLQNALQAVADREGLGLAVELTSSPGWRFVAARVEADGRSANIHMISGEQRCFVVDCWTGGVRFATGDTQDLSKVVGALHAWLQGPRVRELVAQWPFLRTWELAEAHERGEAVPVRWHQLREAAACRPDPALYELVEAAFAQPRLRALSPGQSMYWLTFSRRAAPPICNDLPKAMPIGDGHYRVRHAGGVVREVDGAAEAVAAILAGLPEDAVPSPCGA